MHEDSYRQMAIFTKLVETHYTGQKIRMLDVGSQDVNGTYKDLFSFGEVEYIGLDIKMGPNVDVVPRDFYNWAELEDDSFDVIISGQALEHIEYPWLVITQIARKLKPNGLICLIAPSRGHEHQYPVDCYRYLPDGMRALAKWSGLTVVEVGLLESYWGDCYCTLTKNNLDSFEEQYGAVPDD